MNNTWMGTYFRAADSERLPKEAKRGIVADEPDDEDVEDEEEEEFDEDEEVGSDEEERPPNHSVHPRPRPKPGPPKVGRL